MNAEEYDAKAEGAGEILNAKKGKTITDTQIKMNVLLEN